jgi:hypothetical protein
MKNLVTTANGEKLNRFVFEKMQAGELDNGDLVQLIELCGDFLNLKTIPDYAKENNLSYNGVKKHRNIITLFNQKFVIDND